MADGLTPKQKMFADEYVKTGNATQSYITAYPSVTEAVARANASRLLTNANIKTYIENVNQELHNNKIADMKEIKEFWTELVRSKEIEPKDRLKASEFIAKTNGAFIDKVEHSGEVTIIKVKPPSFGGDD